MYYFLTTLWLLQTVNYELSLINYNYIPLSGRIVRDRSSLQFLYQLLLSGLVFAVISHATGSARVVDHRLRLEAAPQMLTYSIRWD